MKFVLTDRSIKSIGECRFSIYCLGAAFLSMKIAMNYLFTINVFAHLIIIGFYFNLILFVTEDCSFLSSFKVKFQWSPKTFDTKCSVYHIVVRSDLEKK